MHPSEIFEKKILISPLNWGMGHASRCIPLIKRLKKQHNEIFIACSEIQREIFKCYFEQEISYILHEEYPFRFKGRGNFISDSVINFKKLKKRHQRELSEVNNYIDEYEIDIVISDHRYGFRSAKCTSIFMTHQLQLPLPWYLKVIQDWHSNLVSKFNFQWIVDDEFQRLAGKLSDNENFPNSMFIGHLSRFEGLKPEKVKEKSVLIVSGPTEYYSQLFDYHKSKITTGEIELIIGNDMSYEILKKINKNVNFHNSKNWKDTDSLIVNAKRIFGYCGYSTLMDIKQLGCEFNLTACPGQLEQLYIQKKVLRNFQDFNL
jgi:uncharacterized protein (TIGR00661 family)